MALVGLLFAHHTMVGAAEPFAAIMIAGLSSLERQVRLVRSMGAERIFVVAERMPPLLSAALARLNGEVTVLRDPALLGSSLGDDDRVLVLEEGLLLDDDVAAHFVEQVKSVALAVAVGEPPYPQAERLDANSFWAGIAVYEARFVRAVAADLGDWDLQSTLLRFAAGEGLPRVTFGEGAISVRNDEDAGRAVARLTAAAERPRRSWLSSRLHQRIERAALRWLLPTRANGAMLWAAALAAGVLAIAAFANGWLWAGLLLALLTEPLAGTGETLSAIKLEAARRQPFDRAVALLIEPGWYLGLAIHFMASGSGGAWAVAALIIAFRVAADRQQRLLGALAGVPAVPSDRREQRLELFGAAPDTMPWLLLPFAIVGTWQAGFVALAAYAVATFFLSQSSAFRRLAG